MQATPLSARITSIDQLRGAVMVLMLVDHAREFFYLHQQVADPMDLGAVSPELFFTRLTSHFCAPLFVLLTGLSAWLYGSRPGRSRHDTAAFLATRGVLLIVLEITVVNFAWSFSLPPPMIYLQVIWVIGLSMLALAALLWLPRALLIALMLLILCGHNALDGIHFARGEPGFVPWAILHERSIIELGTGLQARTSYPALPWVGIILAGYLLGPLYAPTVAAAWRQRVLCGIGLLTLAAFVALRMLNVYGDHAWVAGATLLESSMAFFNLTKYPPSLHFVLLTLGVGLPVLAGFERMRTAGLLGHIGGAPMFFYLAHLYLLHAVYLLLAAHYGPNQGARFGFEAVWQIWAMAAAMLVALYWPCRAFARYRQTSGARWTSYF